MWPPLSPFSHKTQASHPTYTFMDLYTNTVLTISVSNRMPYLNTQTSCLHEKKYVAFYISLATQFKLHILPKLTFHGSSYSSFLTFLSLSLPTLNGCTYLFYLKHLLTLYNHSLNTVYLNFPSPFASTRCSYSIL